MSNNHPAYNDRPGGDDPEDEAFIRAVAARQAARLGRPIPTDNDPATVRGGLAVDRSAMMLAVAVLHRNGCGATVPDALDAVLDGKPLAAAFDLPPGVAGAILERTPDRHAPTVFEALDTELQRFAVRAAANPAHCRQHAELSAHRLYDATRTGLAASIADGLPVSGTVVDGTPITDDMRAQAADFAAGIAIATILDRLRDDLAALAGLP